MNKTEIFGKILYAFINLVIFSGAFIFVGKTFMTNTQNINQILFGGAMMLILIKYFIYEIFNTLSELNDVKLGADE